MNKAGFGCHFGAMECGFWDRDAFCEMDVSENSGISPQIIHFYRVFHYKPSILGYPLFLDTPKSFCHGISYPKKPFSNLQIQVLWQL